MIIKIKRLNQKLNYPLTNETQLYHPPNNSNQQSNFIKRHQMRRLRHNLRDKVYKQ
jgi:hypothetical protein